MVFVVTVVVDVAVVIVGYRASIVDVAQSSKKTARLPLDSILGSPRLKRVRYL